MKPLSSIEQIGLVFSLAVVAAMLTQCATPAHASDQPVINCYGSSENQQSPKPYKTLLSIVKVNCTSGDASEYALFAHPHDEFGLVTNNHLAQMPRSNHAALFCVSFSTSVMVRLDGDTFECASCLSDLLTNPVQSNRLRLVTNDSTSINHLEVNYHD